MINKYIFFIFLFFVFFVILAQSDIPTFSDRITLGLIEDDDIDEASGIAASSKNPGVIWVHNDSGDKNRIFAIDTSGNDLGEYTISGAENRDWEDIAVGSGPDNSKSYIYIGDIGDNDGQYTIKYIYRIEEPLVSLNQNSIKTTLSNVEKISFYYPDSPRDAETLMLDPITKDIFIISKRNSKIRIYRLPFPQSTTQNIEAEKSAEFQLEIDPEDDKPFNYLTAGDISKDGNEILIKSYTNIFYWYRNPNETISEVLSSRAPELLPFQNTIDESQGEAVCWKPFADKGYYTLSEEKIDYNGTTFTFPAYLYYYKRTSEITSLNDGNLNNDFRLYQNFPNPFNPVTKIKYTIPINNKHRNTNVKLVVYDVIGNEVALLKNENQTPGNYEIEFNGSKLTSGIYYYELRFGNYRKVKKMVLLK